MNEFDLIDIIRARCATQRGDVALAIGDDAAVVDVPAGMQLVACTDTLIAGRHFPIGTRASDIGWKSLAVNLSDLAAMGAEPAWAMLALSLPESNAQWLGEFADGFSALATQYAVALIGGDTTRGPLSITVTALGLVPKGLAITRSGARAGDAILICGVLGEASAGLDHLARSSQDGRAESPDRAGREQRWVAALDRPSPQIAAGLALRGLASSAIDISDGLLADLGHVIRASDVGARLEIESMPGYQDLREALGTDVARRCVLAGGDDYALCVTVAPADVEIAKAAVVRAGCAVTQIGSLSTTAGIRVHDAAGQMIDVERAGWDHFG